jgi:hypothetical protein
MLATPPRTTLFPPLGLVTRTNGVGIAPTPPGGNEGGAVDTGVVLGGRIRIDGVAASLRACLRS